jgi:AhpD family alkylhydroperoxidase
VPRVPVHTLDDAPEQTRPTLENLQKKTGKLLNIHAEMAHSPVVLAVYAGMQEAIATHGTFDVPTREAIALAVGAVDGCEYCQSAHTLAGKAAGLDADRCSRSGPGTIPHAGRSGAGDTSSSVPT